MAERRRPSWKTAVIVGGIFALIPALLVTPSAHAVGTTYTISTQADFDAISARIYAPGDTILFQRGQQFTGNLTFLGSGNPTNPVTLDATGSGSMPIITASGANSALKFHGVSYYTIQNLEITAPQGTGIDIQLADSSPTADVTGFLMSGMRFHDIQNVVDNQRQLSKEFTAVQNKVAVMIGTWHDSYATMTNYRITNVTIQNSEFYDVHNAVYSAGNVSFNNGFYADKPLNENITVKNSSFYNILGEGSVFLGTKNSLISDNSYINVSHMTGTNIAPVWMVGSDNITVQRSQQYGAVPSDGMFIDFDWRTSNSTYQYNYSSRNGEWAFPCSVLNNHDNVIRYNISNNDFGLSQNCSDSTGGEHNLKVYNNTLINFGGWALTGQNMLFENNLISYQDTSKSIVLTGSGNSFDHNAYVNGSSTETGAVNISDPKLVRVSQDPQGFKLAAGSPLIDAGTVVPNNGNGDYFGNSLYKGSPDIGAAEYYIGAEPLAKRWNLAEGATITASSAFQITNWNTDALADGITSSLSAFSSNRLGYSSSSNTGTDHTEWVVLDFGSQKTFSKVVLWPRSDPPNSGLGFPKSFQIQVWDGTNWITRVAQTNYTLTSNKGQEFTWGRSDYTDKIRVNATALGTAEGNYYLQLAEVQVFNDTNLAAGVSGTAVTTSSSVDGYGWTQANLVDGYTSSFGGANGWSSIEGITSQHQEWAQLRLPGKLSINSVTLYPRNDSGNVGVGFPSAFQIQIWDGSNWVTKVTQTGYAQPSTGQTFSLGGAVSTDRVRVVGTTLRQIGSEYIMQLAEVEVQ